MDRVNGRRFVLAIALLSAFVGPAEAVAHGWAHEHEAHHDEHDAQVHESMSTIVSNAPVISAADEPEGGHPHPLIARATPPRHDPMVPGAALPVIGSPVVLLQTGHVPAAFAIAFFRASPAQAPPPPSRAPPLR